MGDNAPGALHVLGNTFTQTCQRLTLILSKRCGWFRFLCWHGGGGGLNELRPYNWRLCRGSFGAFGIGAYVFEGDTTVSIRGSDLFKVHAKLEGEFAYGGGSEYTRFCGCCP